LAKHWCRYSGCLIPLLLALEATALGMVPALRGRSTKALQRVLESDPWFECTGRPGVFAIYEPHQAEEVISYHCRPQASGSLDTNGIANIHR